MAIYKCKMCGGELSVSEGEKVVECEYCGTQQTLPSTTDENIQGLFNRANLLRQKNEFDKAEAIYEKIIQNDERESEAYWGVILCKFGIEYVEDPKTYKRIPTCHRTSYESIVADDYYKKALQYADVVQRTIYEKEAMQIDEIQKGILAISANEEPYDVFICYKETDSSGNRTKDSVIANEIYHNLTNEGFKVFYAAITLEDKLGSAYEPIIFAALNSAKVMLSIGTKPEYFNAVWVKNEWSRFLKMMKNDHSKMLIPCYKDMDAYELPEEFSHLQAQDMSKIGFINDVVRGIKKIIKKPNENKKNEEETQIINKISSLTKKGLEYLKSHNIVIYGEKHPNLKKFGDGILEEDSNNFYGRLFLIMSSDYQRSHFDICGNVTSENEQKLFADCIINAIESRLQFDKLSDAGLSETDVKKAINPVTELGLPIIREMSKKNDSIKEQYDAFCNRLEKNTIILFNFVGDYFKRVSFEAYNIKESKFTSYCEMSSNLVQFVDLYGESLSNKKEIFEISEQVFNVVKMQIKIVTENEYKVAIPLLESWAKLSRNDISESSFLELTKITVSGGYILNRKTVITLYEDKVIFDIEGLNFRTIYTKDIICINDHLDISLGRSTLKFTYTLWYDLLYKINDSTYTLLHFYYEFSEYEKRERDKIQKQFKDWAYVNKISTSSVEYEVNPFVYNYNGLTYEATQPDRKAGCYIATCVYGSYDCPEVWTLRRFRDFKLDKTWHGRMFIKLYYAISPTIVKIFGKKKWFKKMWKSRLDRMVTKLQDEGVENTPYDDKY